MSDVLRFSKKLFTWSVVAMTIAWSVGLSALLPAGSAVAAVSAVADVEAGDLIKLADQSSVYYVNEDMERMYFAFGWLYKTWFSNYDAIKTLPAGTDLDEHFPPASRGAVSQRPGSCESMKSPASPAVYVVSYGGVRHKIASEEAAVALCGASWASHVHDLPDFIISLFPIGGELDGNAPFPGQLIRSEADGPVYVVGEDSKAYAVDGSLPAFMSGDVRLVSQAQWDALVGMGEGSRSVASLTSDVAQLGSEPSDDNDDDDDNSTSTSSGDLKISLAGNTAEADVVPGGAQNVEYLSVVLEAMGGDLDIDSLTFHRGGVGDKDDFDKVYLYHDGMRLENGRSLNTDDEVTFNVNLHIESGDSETLVVKADMETVAGTAQDGDQNRFEIRTEDDVDASGADVSGSFPIRGNLLVVGAQDIGTVTITAGGTDTTVKIGQDGVKVGEFDVEASSDDINVTSVVLQQKGSIDLSALSNIVLKHGGNTVAEGVVMDDDKVKFEFETADQIDDGDQVTYRVYADVGVADVSDTVQFILDEDSDFSAWSEDNAGFEVGVTNTDLDAAGAMELTVEGGKINVDFEGESEEVRQDQNDASFGIFTILATAEDIDVNSMDFVLNKTANTLPLTDMKLRDKNGHGTYSLEATSTISTASALWTVTVEDLNLEQGVLYEFEVLGDVPSTATSNYSYNFSWLASGVDAEGVASDNDVEADDFSSSALTGPTIDVDTSSLVVRSSALSDDTVVNGTKNVLLYRGTLEAGSTSDIEITSMTFGTSSASNAWEDRLDGLKLFIVGLNDTVDPSADSATSLDNTVSDNEAIFDGFNVMVQKGSANRMKFEVYGDITDGSTTGDVSLEVTDVDANDEDDQDVDAEDSSGVAITGLESDRVITIAGTGTLSMVIDNDYADFKNDRYALAGTAKFLAGRIKLQADQEDVDIQDLSIRFVTSTADTTTTTLDNSIDTISIYSNPSMADNTLLGTADFSPSTTIQDINYTVPDGQTSYLYIGLKLNSIGTEADGTANVSTTFKIKVDATGDDIKGHSSNDDITPSQTFTLTNDIAINPMKITNVWSDFAGGTLVGGNQNIFSFKVTADAGRNTDSDGDVLSAHLLRLSLELSTDVGSGVTSNTSALELCRVDSGNCITLAAAAGDFASGTNTDVTLVTAADAFIDMTDFADAEDEYVDDGETVEYVVKGTFANVTDHFVQVKLIDLNSNGLRYALDTDGDGTDEYVFTDIRKDAPRGTDYPKVTGESLD